MFNRRYSAALLWILAFLLVAAGVFYLFTEPEKWDHPLSIFQTQSGTFKAGNVEYSYDLSCNCPLTVIEGTSTGLTFELKLTRRPPATTASTVAAAVQVGAAEIQVDASASKVEVVANNIEDPRYIVAATPVSIPFKVDLEGIKSDLSQINIRLAVTPHGASGPYTFQSWMWPIQTRPPFSRVLFTYAGASLVVSLLGGLAFWLDRRHRLLKEEAQRKISEASLLAKDHPGVAKFAWDVAQANLQAYFDRNLIQVNLVFWVACAVMTVGFLFVLAGVWLAYIKNAAVGPQLVAAASGIITQFIGATFMIIYRSTMAQANEFMTVLERINSVGMAVQILDAIKDGTELKDKTRAELAMLLLAGKLPLDNRAKPNGTSDSELK